MKSKDEIVAAIHDELILRKAYYAPDEEVTTIYFGGGTPSVLSAMEVSSLLQTIQENFNVATSIEITLEANPDDLTRSYLEELFRVGVNRLSIGIQSFNDDILTWMNRSHTHAQSMECIKNAAEVGFKDITIDLIYGIPQLSLEEWKQTVDRALKLPVNHLSAYSLTLEENTPYNKLVKQKKYKKPNDDLTSAHFRYLVDRINEEGWEHYEVSNFCQKGNYSKHNTSYWQGRKYLGIGPSAHSFDLQHRYWNIPSNADYLSKMREGDSTYEQEELTTENKINERIMTGLRTKWGVNLKAIKREFDYDLVVKNQENITLWKSEKLLTIQDESMVLTTEGVLFADYISSELFVDENYSSQTSS